MNGVNSNGSEIGPSLTQLLHDPRQSGNIHEKRAFLQDVVQHARFFPPGSTYSSLCRQLAKVSFDIGDDDDGIFNLIESHAVLLRHKMMMNYHRTIRKNPSCTTVINKKYIEFQGEYCDGFNSVLNRLEDMPKEWTIVQFSCAVDAAWRLGGIHAKQWTPTLHVVRMECGQLPDMKPLHLEICPPPECLNFIVLEEVQNFCKINKTDHLRDDKHAFWEARRKADEVLNGIIDFTNSKWLGSIGPFLTGHLADNELKKKISDSVLKISKRVCALEKCTLSDVNLCLLVKVAENINLLNEESLIKVVARAVNKCSKSTIVKSIAREFEKIQEEYSVILTTTPKHPVILIIDEKLDSLPFECLDMFKDHPVTRVPSLHFVHGLYSVHKDTVKNGLKMLDPLMGFYVINPSKNLMTMEERMSKFILPRAPVWSGVMGESVSEELWAQALKENDVFVYMGHGSGSQYWNCEQFSSGCKSTVLLFGCKSAAYKAIQGCVEVDASLQAFMATAWRASGAVAPIFSYAALVEFEVHSFICPCLIGMLWDVTDKDTDLVAQTILDSCLPRYDNQINKKGKKKGNQSVEGVLPPVQPDVARAINLGRKVAKMIVTRSAVVMRGLPVFIK